MLHLVIICIVCAAFAPSDNTAFNGQKKNESNIFYNFEGGEQNVAKVSSPSVYNVVGRNSSDYAKLGITFFYDYFIKQYQNSKSNSCSIMERDPLGENKNPHSNVDLVYRKRNLLWVTDEKRFQPKTLRPPTSSMCCNRPPAGNPSGNPVVNPKKKNRFRKLKLCSSKMNLKFKWKKHKAGRKFGQTDRESLEKADLKNIEKCTLSPKEKKMFLFLKRCGAHKNKRHKANLDTVHVDDDLDLNKRIKKLVDQLAAENHRKKERFEERITAEGGDSEIGRQNPKNEDELSPILSNIKKMFTFNTDNFNGNVIGNAKTDPVSRVRYPNPEKAENTVSSYDVLRTMRKTVRLRRNPHKSHNSNEFNKNRGPKYKNNLTGWSNPYSANFKANVNFLYPQRNRKFFSENTKKRRWMKMRMRRNRQKKGLRNWPILRRTFEKFYTLDTKPTFRDKYSDSNRKHAGTSKSHRSCVNKIGTSEAFLNDETLNRKTEGQKDSETLFKIVNPDTTALEQREATTENKVESTQPEFLFHLMEKPLLEKQLKDDSLKMIKDTSKLVTEGPSKNAVGLQEYNILEGIKNHVNPLNSQKNRHIRDNTDHNKVHNKNNSLHERKKGHGSKFSPVGNKNWKSSSVLYMPYIRKGEEDQIKCLIKVIQNVLGKQIPLKCDTLEQSEYKASCGKRRSTPRDSTEERDSNQPSELPYPCSVSHFRAKLFHPFSISRAVLNSKIPYERVNAENSQEQPLDSSSTPSSTTTLRTTESVTTASVTPFQQPQTATTKSTTVTVPIFLPVLERSGKINRSPEGKGPAPEPSSLPPNIPVTHSGQPVSSAPPGPAFSSSAKSLVSMQTKIPTPTAFPYVPSIFTTPPRNPSTFTTPPCDPGTFSTPSFNPSTFTTPLCTTPSPLVFTTICTTDKFPQKANSPPLPVLQPSTAPGSGRQVQPSTVNSYALQESESQNENEGTPDTRIYRGEECTTMISHFLEVPSEDPQVQQKVDQVHTSRDVCYAHGDNPMSVRLVQQTNSKSVDSQYRALESKAGFKGTERYNSDHLSRVGLLKGERSSREVEIIRKFFGNEGSEATFRDKRFHHSKKRNSKVKPRDSKKFGSWINHFKEHYFRLLEKSKANAKTKSKPVSYENESTKPPEEWFSTVENPVGSSWQDQKITNPIFSTPVYVNRDYLPIYDHQTEKIIYQSTQNPKQLKTESLMPIFDGFHLDGGPYKYALYPPPEQNKNYFSELTTKPYLMSYDVESRKWVHPKRQKRSDEYYVWPENDYNDYFYDLKDPEESSGGLPPLKEDSPEAWTPPSYDMFRELAKAVAQTDTRGLEEKRRISTSKPVTTTGVPPPSDEQNASTLPTTSPTNPTTQVVTPTTAATTAATPTTTTTTTTAAATTTTTGTTTTTTTISPATASTTTRKGKTKAKHKGGKKTYERFGKHSGSYKNLVDPREDKERQAEELVTSEDILSPTTLKAAAIVRGQKKFQGKPCPKVYMKVFPDSFEKIEQGGGETLVTTTARAAETINIVKTTEQGIVRSDLRLQILAVCEGYLEVVKLIKAQNQTLAEDTDENLARYCENIISQHFNFQSEKCKKFELNELITPAANKKDLEKDTDSNEGPELYEDFISPYDSTAFPKENFRDVPASDNSEGGTSKRKQNRNSTSKSQSHVKRRKKRRNVHHFSRKFPKLGRIRKKKEDSEGRAIGKEQKQLIQLLRERKKALLSWLLTANDGIKPEDLQETEYFDEEDLADPESDTSQYSGTIKPRRDEQSFRTTQKNVSNSKETFYPVYAKDYGYESGGELIEVEVLWRQVNEKTHENKIFKNLSVLALLLTSTPSPKIKPEETKLVGDDNEIDTETKWKKNKFAFDAAKMEAETDNSNSSSANAKEYTENSTSYSRADLKKLVKTSNKPHRKKQTHTIISKPDPTWIVGAPTYINKTHRKISHKYGVAKDIFQEYSIEFLNYAVYILPVMFTILFFLCCLCCALQILKIQKGHKKRKKKKKKLMSSEDTSVSGTSETESKKRKRECKRKRTSGSKENYDNAHKKSKTFWNYLKVYSKPSREMDEENDQTEKKKSFLGFLKVKRDDGKPGYSSAPTRETDDEPHVSPGNRVRKHYSDQYLTGRLNRREHDKHRNEEQGEAAERRELIALLEELKKIETEHIEGKKEVKSVQVQYAFPEYDNPLFQPKSQMPDFTYPYEKNVFGMPKGICPFYDKKFPFHPTVPPSSRDFDLYDVNELTKLLPWECYPQRNDFLKHCDIKINQTGRCDRFLKLFRDSGMNCNRPIVDKNCKTNESESRSFIFNKYRSINMEKSEELRGVSTKISGTEVRLMENVSPCKLSSNRDEDLVEDVENLKRQLNKKKYVRLKDEGVLCRL